MSGPVYALDLFNVANRGADSTGQRNGLVETFSG